MDRYSQNLSHFNGVCLVGLAPASDRLELLKVSY